MGAVAALSEKFKEIARRELNETPETKQQALSQLRQLISEDHSLCCPTDEAFLIKFLRARKYNVLSTLQNIENYFRARKANPEMFDGIRLCSVPFDACSREHRIVTLSNRRDLEGRFVYRINLGAWNTSISTLNDVLRLHVLYAEYVLLKDEAQIMGVTFVLDLEGLGIHHLLQFTPSVIKKCLHLLQDCFPLRAKGFYIINNPAIFDIFFSVAKPFLKTKLLQRIHVFGKDVEKMRGLVPDDIISEAHGGTHEKYDYEKMARELESCEEFTRYIERFGYR